MLYTILQVSAFQALFLLVYDIFLKRETFFNYNRAYLILTAILSLVLPFVKFPELKTMTTKDVVIRLPEVFIGTKTPSNYDIQIAEHAGIIIEQPQTPIWQIVAIVGMVITALIFLVKITKIYRLKHQNPKRWNGNILVVNLIKSSAAFSFFNTIFLGDHISATEKPTIYKHEMVHIKELHTVDLLFFELLRIVFWFNPLVYMYQKRIKELHEYIADAKAVKQTGKSEYYTSLLNQVLDVNHVSFTNSFFNKSLIKKRITMLQKSKSKQLNLIKYALLLPLVFGMLIYTSTEVRAQKNDTPKQELSQELTDAELIKKYYDEYVAMEKNGSTFFEITEHAGFSNRDNVKYLSSRTEFLKLKAYMEYIADGILKHKSIKGTLTRKDLETTDLMRLSKFETYNDYKTYKNTKEAKERWEANARDGILRLFVEELGNQTTKDKARLDGFLKQLENGDYEKIVMTDGASTFIIEDYQSPKGYKEEKVEIEVPFSIVDETPTTIDCKDLESNADRKNCMNMFVNKHIAKHFNTSIGDSLPSGRKRIFVQFKIGKDGIVKDVKARGPSEALEVEAKRVIATLPQFIPGKQRGKVVTVPFSIPIVFQVNGNDKISQETKTYRELVAKRDRILQTSEDGNPVVIQLNKQISELEQNLERDMDSTYLETLRKREEKLIERSLKDGSVDIPFSEVEIAPMHPDCDAMVLEEDKRNCFATAINKHVGQNFNMKLADSLGLTHGKKRIYTYFTVNKKGVVDHIVAKGPHLKLEEETVRVLKLLPQFKPGKQDGNAVDVRYSLPIVFQINDIKND
ncbi:energy transducer TonB [Winogradskyella eckloniae]|uniref:M56 family metallopeptidase n=1 Tax=Winogradskyella eckloniae TaxID=1089306 RepID=UPI0015633149|nr:M56 family metallopeptidase [Winogradskyella eckloniae]NRD19183.1 energy transducer TonB [Winogradskyella eckloniae]